MTLTSSANPANYWTRYSLSLLVACQNGTLTSVRLHDVARRKKLAAVTFRTQWSLRVSYHPVSPRPPAATVQCGNSPCAHIQHGHVGTNANGMSHVSFIPPSSAETSNWHQIPSTNLEQRPLAEMRVQPTDFV